MIVRTLVLVALVALVNAQQGHVNYVEDYDYQDSGPARRPPARPSPPQAFAHRNAAGPTTSSPRVTPVPILKQINKHNEDGSYTYGYEGADGSFKIETKYTSGDVKGKYGYVDDTGKLRVVEYGADRYGFQPQGEGITVAPPTLVDESITEEIEEDPLSFRARPQPRPAAPQNRPRRPPPPPPSPQHQYHEEPQPVYREPPVQAPRFRPEESYEIQTSFNQPQPQQRPAQRPRPAHGGGSPVPARAVIPGAAQVQPQFHAPPQHSQTHSAPRAGPARPRPPQPIPQAHNFGPAPAPAPLRQAPRQVSHSGILDQLARDYALPQSSGVPLHDISFGYY